MKQTLTLKELQQLLRRYDSRVQNATDQTKADLSQLYKNFLERTQQLLATGNREDAIEARELISLTAQLTEALDEAGLSKVVNGYRAQHIELAMSTGELFRDMGFTKDALGGIDTEFLDALIDFNTNELIQTIDARLVRPVQQFLVSSLAGGKDANEVRESLRVHIENEGILRKDGEEFTDANLNVLVGDTYRGFSQHVREEKAQELDLDLRYYDGPDDEKNRDACDHLLHNSPLGGSVWPLEALLKEEGETFPDGSELVNVLVDRGGWNCRHHWFPIDKEGAERLGLL